MVYDNLKQEYHVPVLLQEVLNGLDGSIQFGNKEQKIIVDATAGGMGHSKALAQVLSKDDDAKRNKLICIDRDDASYAEFKKTFGTGAFKCETAFSQCSYETIKNVLGTQKVDVILADLGVSSHQIDDASRGFSYMNEGPLDMRMCQSDKRDASHVVNNYSLERLTEIIREYGEERYAKQIATAIVGARPLKTTTELAKVIQNAVPGSYFKTGGHPAKRTFQAIRIEVNGELVNLEKFVRDAVDCLKPNGRLLVITFHSLEDRIVKQTFKELATDCICPPKIPKCICNHHATIDIITKKPIVATEAEMKKNPRSHSAKLRIVQKKGEN